MDFRPLDDQERDQLQKALKRNAGDGAALLTDKKDTTFVGFADDVSDEEVITAIKSVPCHYAERQTARGLDDELKLMAKISDVIEEITHLPREAQGRVHQWALAKLSVQPTFSNAEQPLFDKEAAREALDHNHV